VGPFPDEAPDHAAQRTVHDLDHHAFTDQRTGIELKIESLTPATPTPFEDLRDTIADSVYNERRLEALDEFLTKLRDDAIIEWKDEGLKGLYDEYLVQRVLASAAP